MWDRCYLAWEMRHSGASYGEIHAATRLFKNINGYDTFFDNPIYTGDLSYGDKVYEGFVPALIPKVWFEEEQKKRTERGKKRKGDRVEREFEPRRMGNDYLLSGLVFCGAVDGEEHPMHIESIPAQKGKRGKYTFFICTTLKNTRGTHCDAKRISIRTLEEAVIENLLTHVLTSDNLRPLAENLARSLAERNRDAGTRITVVEDQLEETRRSLDNILDAIENMGYAPHLKQRYDTRKREEEELASELARLKKLRVKPAAIAHISDEMLDQWIQHIREAFENGDQAVVRRTIRQFVAKIVVKNET
jgi:site-specific DNA recombinase